MTTEQNKQWQVLDHNYTNTGGNCMVSSFAVWVPQQNRTLFATCNEEGCGLYTVDYILNEVDYDETMLIAYTTFDCLRDDDVWLDMWVYCRFEYIKKDCKYFNHNVFMAAGELPQYLLDQVPAGYAEWLDDRSQLIETDGFKIFVDSCWQAIMVDDAPYIIELKKLQAYMTEKIQLMDNDETSEQFYNLKASISFGDHVVVLDNCAAVYTAWQEAIDYIISQD